ncbi:MAG: ATP-binding protein, partial [Acidobacteria bacterium]|nr:ATP-binding protein [Acidobacteriota bacterium]
EDHLEEFGKVREAYTEIFPTVLDIVLNIKLAEDALEEWSGADAEGSLEFKEWLSLGVKEKGVEEWVLNDQISAGMLRALIHLFEIALAARGTVIIVDEFENSMGVNCLPQMTDHFLRHSDLQFILTSHHPYVINNVPWRYWKLVTRAGSEVTVKDATSIPSLDSASSLEKFTQLLNLEEYTEAIR